jgi:hypothetical protein
LKKALVMRWDEPIIEKLKHCLDDEIDDLEEEDKR